MMERRQTAHGWRWVWSASAWGYLWLPVIAISILHYSTGAAHHWLHDIFRRLYYIPIVLGAFGFGLRGALSTSLLASIIYMPHAFTHMAVHDPAHTLEKFLEILLYNVVALITGLLADRQYRTARRLEDTLDDKNQMERELIRAGRLQSLGELTAGLAHEIKNPLASLKGSADILADEIPADSPRYRMLEIHRKEIDRLNNLLERFLSFARPAPFTSTEIHVCHLIDRTISLIDPQAARRDIGIEWVRSNEELRIHGDPEKITQVLLNIVLNAIQASPDGEKVKIACRIAQRGKKRYGVIEVRDCGPGIPEADRERVFNPFVTTRSEGTGLGLSVASRIVDEHHGFIEIDDNRPHGCIFRVYFPWA